MKKHDSVYLPGTLKEAVYGALAFFDQFDYPLTIAEIESYMLGVKVTRDVLNQFLVADSGIDKKGIFYFFSGRQCIVNERLLRDKIAHAYWRKVRFYVPLTRLIPFIRSVAVCNTLAFNCPTRQSDIDLFVLTKSGRIFTARTGLSMLFAFLGVRRHGEKVAGRFCLSFFLTEGNANLESMRRGTNDVYLLYWFRTLKPVFGREAFSRFIDANRWLGQYFFDFDSVDTTCLSSKGGFVRCLGFLEELLFSGRLGECVESFLRKSHMKRHARRLPHLSKESSVVVSDSMLKYHNIDRRNDMNDAFFKRLKALL